VNVSSVLSITQVPLSLSPSCFNVTEARGALSSPFVVSLNDQTPETSALSDPARKAVITKAIKGLFMFPPVGGTPYTPVTAIRITHQSRKRTTPVAGRAAL
jgi:hypothetical protein